MNLNTFPCPSGPYAVGTKVFHISDLNRQEIYSIEARQNRELIIKLYYPCEGSKKATRITDVVIPYWQKYLKPEIAAGLITQEMLKDFTNIHTYSVVEAEPIRKLTCPLILFSPGYDSGPYAYTAFCEGLASDGYVVCFINHTYAVSLVSFLDGRDFFLGAQPDSQVIDVCAADIPFVLEEITHINSNDSLLKGIMDLKSVAIIGHSLGGMVSINSAKRIPQIQAGIGFDPPLDPSALGLHINGESYDATETIHKPFLYILAGNHNDIYAKSSLAFPLGKDNFKFIIDDSSHNGFSDYALFKHLVPWLQRVKGDLDTGLVNGFELIDRTFEHIRTFLRKYLPIAKD